ncbi:MAG: M56 family metallopeptidase [Gemmatimonadaceae bacterium]
MIISWLLFALLTGGFLTTSAIAAERLASLSHRPRRFVWLTALILTACWPVVSLLFSLVSRFNASTVTSPEFTAARRLATLVVASPSWAISPFWTRAVIIAWLLCSAVLIARLGLALAYVHRNAASWRLIDLDGTRVHVAAEAGPAVVGFRKMRIVVPEWVVEADTTLRALIIRHEVEHRQARDPLLPLIATVLTALVPWNIPLWFQAHRLRLAIEIDCDRRVLRNRNSWREYAQLLLTIAQQRSHSSPRLVPALLEPSSNLERRITAMRPTSGLSRANAFCLVLAASSAFALACALDKPQSPSASESSQRTTDHIPAAVNPPQVDPARSQFFEFQVEKLASPIGAQYVQSRSELKAAGITGDVQAQYVVDETGRANVSTFKVLNDADPRLAAAVKASLPTWQFEPATVGGRKVKQLVQQSFQFGG